MNLSMMRVALKLLISATAVCAVLSTGNASADSKQIKRSYTAAGNCEYRQLGSDYAGTVEINADGSISLDSHPTISKVKLTCSLPIKTDTSNSFYTVSARMQNLTWYGSDNRVGKPRCSIRFMGNHGEYRGAIYKYATEGKSYLTFSQPDWLKNYQSAVLSCEINNRDILYGFLIREYDE